MASRPTSATPRVRTRCLPSFEADEPSPRSRSIEELRADLRRRAVVEESRLEDEDELRRIKGERLERKRRDEAAGLEAIRRKLSLIKEETAAAELAKKERSEQRRLRSLEDLQKLREKMRGESPSEGPSRSSSINLLVDISPPNWDALQTTAPQQEGVSTVWKLAGASVADESTLRTLVKASSTRIRYSIADRPFSLGGCRAAFHFSFRLGTIPPESNQFVAKRMISSGGKAALEELKFNAQQHEIANLVIKPFNQSLKERGMSGSVNLVESYIVQPAGSDDCMAVEKFYPLRFMKFNSNNGFVEEGHELPQALSHFSFHISKGSLILVDVQGFVTSGQRYFLTDPAFHTRSQFLGDTDFAQEGFDHFFSSHVCEDTCRKLGLPPGGRGR